MAAFVKYNSFVDELGKAGHNLSTAVFKAALTNTAPAATDTVWAAGTQIPPTNGNGYTAGGNTLTTTSFTTTSGVAKLILVDTVFTASGGTLGPFQYVILYNSSATNKLIGNYNYGSSITLADTETFTVDFDGANGVLTIT
jgi:hypothetical protein